MATEPTNPAKTKKKEPHPADVHVGKRLRARRTEIPLSQEKLGDAAGLTFQQIQKYERGANRVGASRLYEFSRILGVEIDYFFEDMPPEAENRVRDLEIEREGEDGDPRDPMERDETMQLVKAYYSIENVKVRKRLFDLVKAANVLFAE